LLKAYRWPGNIRELRNVMDRAALLCADGVIAPEHLPLTKMLTEPPLPQAFATDESGGALRVRTADRSARIRDALERCAGNQTEAAKLLGVSRRTLCNWLDR